MNKMRRAEVAKAQALLEEAKTILETVSEEEREAYDNLSEGLQQADRGQQMDANATSLEGACESVDSAIDDLGSVE
jgi:hypothetical protein